MYRPYIYIYSDDTIRKTCGTVGFPKVIACSRPFQMPYASSGKNRFMKTHGFLFQSSSEVSSSQQPNTATHRKTFEMGKLVGHLTYVRALVLLGGLHTDAVILRKEGSLEIPQVQKRSYPEQL